MNISKGQRRAHSLLRKSGDERLSSICHAGQTVLFMQLDQSGQLTALGRFFARTKLNLQLGQGGVQLCAEVSSGPGTLVR